MFGKNFPMSRILYKNHPSVLICYTIFCAGRYGDSFGGRTVGGPKGGGARFYVFFKTGPETQPASCKMGTGFFIRW